MKETRRGFFLSLLIHTGIFLLGLMVIHVAETRQAGKIRAIDFSLMQDLPPSDAVASQEQPLKTLPAPPKAVPQTAKTQPLTEPQPPVIPQAGIASEPEGQSVVQGQAALVADTPEPPRDQNTGTRTASTGIRELAEGSIDYSYIREEILKHISYPERARRMGLEGRAVVSFIILENGATTDIKIIRSSGSRFLDDHTRRRISQTVITRDMPYKVLVTIPIVYALQG